MEYDELPEAVHFATSAEGSAPYGKSIDVVRNAPSRLELLHAPDA